MAMRKGENLSIKCMRQRHQNHCKLPWTGRKEEVQQDGETVLSLRFVVL